MNIQSFEDVVQGQTTVSLFGQQLTVSIYMIDGLLIDTGPARRKKQLTKLFDQWEIKEVILTHHHEDHTGLAHWLQDHKNIPIYMHQKGIASCEKKKRLPLYRHVFWGALKPFYPLPLGETYRTKNYTWDIIHTPGHAYDHIALFNREKGWLFGGDLYVHPYPKSMFAFESLPDLINSLRKILTYDFETYFCSHAGIITEGRRAIEKKLNYLIDTQQEILSLHEKGMSPREIRNKLFPKRHPMQYFSLFENSPIHMVNSALQK